MMIFSIILLTVSFLLQGVLSNFIGYTYQDVSIFSTIYVLVVLLLLYPHFENKDKYLLLLVIFGWLMDVVYSNTLLLNISLLYLVYKFSNLFYSFFPYNLITINVGNVLCIFIYHILSFILLSLLRYDSYSVVMLFRILGCNIIMTSLYTTIIYILINFIKKRIELKEVK